MRILAALNSFKGSLTSRQAGEAVLRGLRTAVPQWVGEVVPISDGGDGFLDVVTFAGGGEERRISCRRADGQSVGAVFVTRQTTAGLEAFIESAAANGLTLIPSARRNPVNLASWGVGELIRAALDLGARRIVLGLGGSATADGGAGAAEALGVRFFDVAGKPVTPLGGKLREIHAIDVSALDPRLKKINLEVACDVDNPLLGPRGAARVFGPQKGASLSDVLALEEGLTTFFSVVEKTLGISVRQEPGAGAAGGLSAGLAAFAGARLTPGFPLLAELVSLAAAVKKADVVVTGEGALDEQTLMGKAPAGVADLARRNGLPVVAFCGRVADPHGRLSPTPFGKIWDLTSFAGSAEAAIAGSAALLERLAEEKAPALSAFAAQYSSNHRKP